MNIPKLSILVIIAFVSLTVCAQTDCPCDKILQEGLYSHFKITNTGNFNQDFRKYLLSDNFQQDMKNGDWGGSITVPIENLPITLGMNSSSSEFAAFHEKLVQSTQFSVSSSYYQTIASSIPNVGIAQIYAQCVAQTCANGFKVSAVYGESWANFFITFKQPVSTDPMPRVRFFEVRNGANVKSALENDKPILDSNVVVCERDVSKDLLLVLQTDRGIATYKIPADPPVEIAKDMPVGTAIASFLNFQQFCVVTKCNERSPGGIWTSAKSKWCPADGRTVTGSLFSSIASQDHVPDLRGMFLRGLNVMDSITATIPPLDSTRRDPDNRSVGSYQEDMFAAHSHQWLSGNGTAPNHGEPTARNDAGFNNRAPTTSVGGSETRPKNIGVFYYIRIN